MEDEASEIMTAIRVLQKLLPQEALPAVGEAFGPVISKNRQAHGFSLDELAKRSGLSKTHIWEIEQGRSSNPTARTVWKLSQALNINSETLLWTAAQEPTPKESPDA